MATSTSSSSASQSQNAGSSFPTFLQSNIPVPGKLDLRGNLAVNWKKFRRIWENYEIATHLNKQDSSLRVATLLSCMGPMFWTFSMDYRLTQRPTDRT